MQLGRIFQGVFLTALALALELDQRYQKAYDLLSSVSISDDRTIYNYDNMDLRIYIPQYNTESQDYEMDKLNHPSPIIADQILPELELLATENHIPSLILLADLYIFGNYSTPTNYAKSLEYYHKVVDTQPHGHAYFMLGFIYGTGLFGEVEKDLAKSALYYQFGVENNDTNSILAIAYKNFKDFGAEGFETTQIYYNKLAHSGLEYYQSKNVSVESDDLTYDIRIPDFNGGIFGEKLSETNNSITRKATAYKALGVRFNEYNLDIDDHAFVHYYYQAEKYYDGDYFVPKNYSTAINLFRDCVLTGAQFYGPTYSSMDVIDKNCLSLCQSKLGRMYLYGQGTERNIEKAHLYLRSAIRLNADTQDAYVELGLMHEQGLISEDGKSDIVAATKCYGKAVSHGSKEGKVRLSKLLTETSPNKNLLDSEFATNIYTYTLDAAYNNHIEGLYHLAEFINTGFASTIAPELNWSPPHAVLFYRAMIKHLESYFAPHLEYAFQQLIRGNFKNALIAYLIAAEQGFEGAQVSAAYLLYQVDPLYSSFGIKTFDRRRVLAAIEYLERSSIEGNTDSSILLGNIYAEGVESCNIELDYNKAYQFYQKASQKRSSHAAYNLGQIYEYGLGPANNTIDYHMAKRFYDLSSQFKSEHDHYYGKSSNKLAIHLAVLRLRLKYMFSRNSGQSNYGEQSSWLSSFRRIGSSNDLLIEDDRGSSSNLLDPEDAHNWDMDDQDYDTADYLVIFITFTFFLIFFLQNFIRQIRRYRANRNGAQENNPAAPADQQNHQDGEIRDDQAEVEDQPRGWRFNRNGFEFRGDVNFQFFAL